MSIPSGFKIRMRGASASVTVAQCELHPSCQSSCMGETRTSAPSNATATRRRVGRTAPWPATRRRNPRAAIASTISPIATTAATMATFAASHEASHWLQSWFQMTRSMSTPQTMSVAAMPNGLQRRARRGRAAVGVADVNTATATGSPYEQRCRATRLDVATGKARQHPRGAPTATATTDRLPNRVEQRAAALRPTQHCRSLPDLPQCGRRDVRLRSCA